MSAPHVPPSLGTASNPVEVTWPRHVVVTVVGICWLLVFFDGMDMFIYGTVLPGMLADTGFGLTSAAAGVIGSVTTFGMLVGALAAGTITDLIGRKTMLAVCCAVFAIASGICAIAGNPEVLGLGRLVAGLGLGGLLPTAITAVAEFAPAGSRNLMIGVLMTGHHAGGIVASGLGLWLLEDFGWRAVFWIGVVPILALPLVLMRMPESPAYLLSRGRYAEAEAMSQRHGVTLPEPPSKESRGALAGLKDLLSSENRSITILFWLASFAGLLLAYGVGTWLPTLMAKLGYDLGSSVAFLLVLNVGGVAGMFIAGRISDTFGPVRVATIWFALTAVAVFLLGTHQGLVLTYVLVFVAGLFLFSGQTMVYAAAAALFPASSRGTAVGWTSGMGRFGAVFGPWMGGSLIASGNEEWGFAAFALWAAFGAIMIGCSRLTRRGRAAKA
ncbi:aromatic acid/H+ symport family MFS transporter [Micrococcales bacterium 31B]|nr:aromatic acid/H+ symport family MFS transporter [Micrococcales bacterium 31B]